MPYLLRHIVGKGNQNSLNIDLIKSWLTNIKLVWKVLNCVLFKINLSNATYFFFLFAKKKQKKLA